MEIGDSAQQTVFFNNDVVSASAQYEYDAVYRLVQATGREHAGGLSDAPRDQNDLPIQSLPHPNDPQALRNYTEQYVYDAVGNLLRMVHQAGTVIWTRWYAYEVANNRLTSTTGDPEHGPFRTYAHDAHGNMTSMPHITALTWDENDQVRSTDLGGGGDVYYDYDAAGQRVRKVWEHSGLVEERIYLGGYEVYRRHNSSGLELERQTLHVMDGARRVAMVETKTVDTSGPFTVTPRVRYQLDNHLGSASLEVDGAGLVIGYEEYHPYGTTAYWSASSAAEVSQRRYRYTGKEKDEETGLYYHGARYYAPWLGRWMSADPAGIGADGPGLFTYARDNPVVLEDGTGRQSANPDEWGAVQFKHPTTEGQFARIHDGPVAIENSAPSDVQAGPAPVDVQRRAAPSRPPAWLRNYMKGQDSAPAWLTTAMAEHDAKGALETIVEVERSSESSTDSTQMNAADVLVGVGQTVNGVGGSQILNALTLGAYGQVTAAISLWEGYQKDGWSGVAMAFNENLNPLYRIPVGIARASEAADRGDFQAVGREVSSAALDTATLVGAAAGLARLPSGLPKVRGTQIGLRAPALVDELKIAMERGTYDFPRPEDRSRA
ncbi:RHS repeat-associated core domain-containing protein [Sorangium sp. So ce134]